MKDIIAERVECNDDDDMPDAIVVGIERNDGEGYENIWMDPDNAIDFADIIRLANISIYRFNQNMKNGDMKKKIRKRSDIKKIKRK